MITNNSLCKEWVSLKKAEEMFLISKHFFRNSSDFFNQLLGAINNLSEQGTALRFIRDEDFNEADLNVLVPIIIDIAVDGNIDNLPIAREILIKKSNNNIIREKLTENFEQFLLTKDEYIYRRLAELLVYLNYNDLRKELLDACIKSNDEGIVEIYTDFFNKY